MSIKVAARHFTKYEYDRQISLGPQVIRLRPAPHSRTHIKSYSLTIRPENHFINWQQDPFGNYLARIVFPEKVKFFEVDVEVIADMVVINPFDFFVEDYADGFPFEYEAGLKDQLSPYLVKNESGPLLMELVEKARSFIKDGIKTVDYLVAINQMIHQELKYNLRMEEGVQSCEDTLTLGSGSCRDYAWLMVEVFRYVGLASRFASGYLIQLKPDEKSLEGPSGPDRDFTDLHAWTEVFIPGAGWIGLDSTSGLFAAEGHIPLACTPNPQDAAAISGSAEPAETTLHFVNEVTRMEGKPRVTKPYIEETWEKILAVGDKVDEDLEANDVRLTMGGEPTFVPVDNQDAPEWNTAADGAHKRQLSNVLFHKLKNEFASGALMHYGQGKWYPGEPLPRWKLACFWRKDGVALWHNDGLMADLAKDYKLTGTDAQNFMDELVGQLNVDKANVTKLYEDPVYFIWQESKVPINVNPYEIDLNSSLERQKLTEVLTVGLDKPVGFSVPLEWESSIKRWQSCRWDFRTKELFLIPGNSPAGFRLPLDSIAFTPPGDDPIKSGTELFAPAGELPTPKAAPGELPPVNSERIFKTSLVVEVREGKLFVFMPPVQMVEHYLDLVSAVERTAERLKIPVLIEGYDPPLDTRIEKMMITPGPGVIKVNVPPAKSWKELTKNYHALYEKARESRLVSEKFNLDGKHTGTGGGNHITLGGTTPENSPLLRRPDVLKSFITYWQHHPSLSYLFSTQHVGSISEAPRVDEGRNDMLYELELAFQQIPDRKESEMPLWMVDRVFRNLLVDITGNTQRAEFCLDKLYAPDSSTGRLGALKFRGLEMPPHYRMGMVQLLLIRALMSWFWREPYSHKLVRWGTSLHDKFLLPHHCEKDIQAVVSDLKRVGYDFDFSWFSPFFTFRFPFIGELQADDIHLDIQMAIEPYHVLGEEISSSGTSGSVDSSMERLQVKISGLTGSRYHLLCNGHRVPLKSTGVQGEYVAGIRYRARQSYPAQYPTMRVDAPLVFDLYDSWARKPVAACQYHVVDPGGRKYNSFPVNSNEAESRRVSRFFDFGHTIARDKPVNSARQEEQYSGKNTAKEEYDNEPGIINPEFPYTMDLRRYKKK